MGAVVAASDGAGLSIWDVFDAVNFRPHKGQIPVIESSARHRVVTGGRRLGKSQIGGHELVPEAIITKSQLSYLRDRGHRREFWIVGPEYSDSEKEFRVIWNCLKRLGIPFDKPGSYNNPISGDMHIACFDGAFQVHAKSAKYPETLQGEGLSGVIMAEAAKLKERVWTKFIRPTLADFHGWSLFSTTPEGKNWLYKLWQDGNDPSKPEWESWRMPSWLNEFVFPLGEFDPEIAAMRADLTQQMFNQEVAALFTEFVGRVFGDFDEETHVFDLKFNPNWETYAAVDYGFTNPAVWLLLQVGPWGEIHVLDEVYERGLTVDEFAQEIRRRHMAPAGMIRFYPDPASPGSSKDLSERLHIPYAAHGTGGLLSERIDSIRLALKRKPEHLPDDHPEKLPTLRIDRKCTETIREFNDYRYPKSAEEAAIRGDGNVPEAPMKKDDHTPEALGRFFAGHFGRRTTKKRRVILHDSNMS